MKHLVIIPAYNEEEIISNVIDSLINQSQPPETLIIVDDGSTDKTASIVTEYTSKYPWIKLVQNHKKDPRATGSKIVKAFMLGLSSAVLENYDLVSKFDADLSFPEDYLETINSKFADSKLGLAGGSCVIESNGDWILEKVAKGDHIRGALKTYRAEAYKEIGGIPAFMGWDSADEFLLRYYGWEIMLVSDLNVKHFRETNELNGWKKTAKLNAQVYHNLRYGFLIGSFSSLKRCFNSNPKIINGILTFFNFLWMFTQENSTQVSKEVGKFIRSYRWKTILKS